ncbi:hypothetical protein F4821DRAFT_738 [Hypoxylon rubiginosum]|uniref:Uncharacterized protein n=1 Tax=Hypoxylon rubiginosum TaxID=110542 RepID=A0ACC0DL34_9PEZI|nr:hypothetical protein F4821DRAFT_738 [Hypoxylon rubiginosum]
MSNILGEQTPIAQPPPKAPKADTLSSNHLSGKEKPTPSSLPTSHAHSHSDNLGSLPSSSQSQESQCKAGTLPGLTIYAVIFIARFHSRIRLKRRLESESQLRVTALFLNILHSFLCARRGHIELGVGTHDAPDIEAHIFLLLVLTYVLFHGGTSRHYENNAVVVGDNNSVGQKVMISLFQVQFTGHTRQMDRDRRPTGFSFRYLLRLHAVYYLGHATQRQSPISGLKPMQRRRRHTTRQRRRLRRERIRWRRRRRF